MRESTQTYEYEQLQNIVCNTIYILSDKICKWIAFLYHNIRVSSKYRYLKQPLTHSHTTPLHHTFIDLAKLAVADLRLMAISCTRREVSLDK